MTSTPPPPSDRSNTTPLVPRDSAPGERRRAKLLLVDDTYANLVALTAVLEPLDQELVTARSGEEALRRLLDADFAAILLDVRMPGLDGFQTATLIRRRERSRQTPIVFLTAHERDPQRVFDGYAHGAVDYLVKPYDPDVLRGKVRALVDLHLSHERARRESEHARRRDRLDLERSNAARQQRLLDAVPHPIWIAQPSTHVDTANKAWLETIGDVTESVSQGFLATVEPMDRAEVERRWRIGVAVEAPFEFECRLRARKGGNSWHLVRCVPDRDPSRGVTWVCTATPTGELHAAEDARDELSSILMHVVRPGLRALTPTTADRLLRFLDALAVDPNDLVFKAQPFDLAEGLQRWCEEAQAIAPARRIEVRAQGPLVIEGDAEQVEGVVVELLAHALGRTPDGGAVDVVMSDHGARTSIAIQDRGTAIGHRIALHRARRIAERLGGRLSVESDRARGTATILEVPRRRLQDTVPALRSPEARETA